MREALVYPLVAALVVVGTLVPAAAVAAISGERTAVQAGNGNVNVTTGPQLATVLSVTSDDVQTEVEATGFEFSFERARDDERRAEAVAERAEQLRERAERIREDYETATEAYREGDLTREEYARRLATLNARAENLLASYERLQQRAANVSALELRAAGLNRTALRRAMSDLDSVTGVGASALLQRFTGQSEGELELETNGGLSIEAESEDGERSREIERPRDDDPNVTVNQSTALDAARDALTTPEEGRWVLASAGIDREEGTYAFEFRLRANNSTGEAEVEVDGSSGEVFSLEEEIQPVESEEEDGEEAEAEDDVDEDADELAVLLAEGTPDANETVTVRVLSDGAPVPNATVSVNDEPVGTTGADGTLTVTLPERSDVEITAERGEAEGELAFELGGEDEDREVFRKLNVSASLDDGTATVRVTFDGSGVANATVAANGEQVGTTGDDGTVTFDLANDTEDLEIEVVKGEFEAEVEFQVQDGSLVKVGEEREADDEDREKEDGGEDTEGEESDGGDEDDEEETTETEDDG